MIRSLSIKLTTVACVLALSMTATGKTPRVRPIKAHVHFLATSTCVRGTRGMNEDVYLAEIATQPDSDAKLVRLVDEYLNYRPALLAESLTSKEGTTLRITRDTRCDLPYSRMLLRTAPGDPMAVIPVKLSYKPQLLRTPEPDEILPCYRTARTQ
jgi:hypothetical protein